MGLREHVDEWFASPRALRSSGVLGMNERNHDFTMRWNERQFYPMVDNKLLTKALCRKQGIPTAQVLAVARYHADRRTLLDQLQDSESFVLKPAHGAMGNGILVVRGREGDGYRLAGGRTIKRSDVEHHISSILSGMFALGGRPDIAFAEECLHVHPDLTSVASDGVPDLRFVIFRGIPVMAMTRLPTQTSGGRANLHQGAVGAGLDLQTGRTVAAVIRDRRVSEHPDTGHTLLGVQMPDFERAIEIAVRATSETGLGYVGADVVVDANRGALILELNARPGLAIQIANQQGLLSRLEAVEVLDAPDKLPWQERVALGREIASRS